MGCVSSNLFTSPLPAFVWKHCLQLYEPLWKLVQDNPEWTEHYKYYPVLGLLFVTGAAVTAVVATMAISLGLVAMWTGFGRIWGPKKWFK
jgi:hypothetical protein